MLLKLSGIRSVVPMFSDLVEVSRPASGTYDEHGRWQEGPSNEFEICASVQTATDKDLQKLPEGRRLRGGIRVYTTSELLTASVDEKRQPDVLTWDGAQWQVEQIDDWFEVAGYYKVIATRMGQ